MLLTSAVLAILALGSVNGLMLEYDVFDVVFMNQQKNISLRLSFDETKKEEENWPQDQVVVLTFNLKDKVGAVCMIAKAKLIG